MKTKVALAHIYAVMGRKEEAKDIVEDVLVHHVLGENDYRNMGLVFAGLGEVDAAFKWLERSFERHEPSLSSLKVDPKLDGIRHDPRFDALIEKVGLKID